MASKRVWMRWPNTIIATLTSGAGKIASPVSPPVDRGHHRDGNDEGEDRLRPIHNARPKHHPHRIQVVGGARHHVARAILSVVFGGERDQLPEQLVAHLELDIAGDATSCSGSWSR